MRVLHVAGNLDADAGGSTSAAFHTCGYLRAHGIDAVLAGTWAGPQAADYIREEWPDLPVHGFPRRTPHHYWHSPSLRRWLRSNVDAFDLVAVHGVFKFPFVDAAFAARRNDVPYLVQPHNSLDPYDLRKHRALKFAYGPLVGRRLLGRSAGVLVTSERERARLVTYGAECHVDVVPLPVAGPATAPDGAGFRRRRGVPPDGRVVLFLSRLDPKKGLERLLAAMVRLRATDPDLLLVVVGGAEDRAYEAALKRGAADLGLGDSVVWTGMVVGAERWDAFAAGDVFALPSSNENFGIVVLEALLAGTPVVISDEVYIADELSAAGIAYVCGTDVDSLVTKLAQALRDGPGRTITEDSRKAIEQTFSPDAVTQATIAVYQSVLARRQRPSFGRTYLSRESG